VRVREILKWSESEQYNMIKNGKFQIEAPESICPHCGNSIDKDWKFCRNCGHEL
jgi:ribosomal protein S27AE